MEVEKFRIQNYRSIKDSKDCYLSPKITVLAGKNEAGKTSILQALRDFTPGKEIEKEACPLNTDLKPEIAVTFKVKSKELEEFLPKDLKTPNNSIKITVRKTLEDGYEVSPSPIDFVPTIKGQKEEFKKNAENNLLEKVSKLTNCDYSKQSNLSEKINTAKNSLSNFQDESKIEIINKYKKQLNETENKWNDFINIEESFLSNIKSKIPNFILFRTYEDEIPNEVPFNNIENSEFIEDLTRASDLDPDLLKKSGIQRKTHKHEVNLTLNKDYDEFWNQDETKLKVDCDNEKIEFWIQEGDNFYPPKVRSDGKRWHLSFYIKLTAHATETNPSIALIDDPGLYLHAKAQEDILKKLGSVSESTKVIYTTHSPYLIDTDHLDRVWLVKRPEGGNTQIHKLHAGADKDTLRPIITAIGANTNLGVQLDKENSVVVEGISDYHYLHAFKELINWEDELNIIPGTGSTSPVNIGSILFGWGVDPLFILDNDNQGNSNKEKLITKLGINEDKIITLPIENGAIEDIFTKKTFKKYVLEDENIKYKSKNSDYLKSNRGDKDKVLLSKKFYESVRNNPNIELDETTLKRIDSIFQTLKNFVNSNH